MFMAEILIRPSDLPICDVTVNPEASDHERGRKNSKVRNPDDLEQCKNNVLFIWKFLTPMSWQPKQEQVIGPILTLVSLTCEVRIRNVGAKRQVKVPTSKNWDFQSDTPPTKSLNF